MTTYAIFFADAGAPKTSLAPSIITFLKVLDGASPGAAPAVSELGGGMYKFTYTPTEDLVVVVDGGVALAIGDRFLPMVIGPQDARMDVAVSSRTKPADTQAAVTVTGSVSGNVNGNVTGSVGSVVGITSSDVGAIKAKTDLIPTGGPTSASVYTNARAAKLDNLDMAISSIPPTTAALIPGGVPLPSGTILAGSTVRVYNTDLNFGTNQLRDGVLRFSTGSFSKLAVRIQSNTAGPNSILSLYIDGPGVPGFGDTFTVTTDDLAGTPTSTGDY